MKISKDGLKEARRGQTRSGGQGPETRRLRKGISLQIQQPPSTWGEEDFHPLGVLKMKDVGKRVE